MVLQVEGFEEFSVEIAIKYLQKRLSEVWHLGLSPLSPRDTHLKTSINYFIVIKQKELNSIQKVLTHPKQSKCFS